VGLKDKNEDEFFPIVGIGASAGGLNSLQCFLAALPKKFGFAAVFMQHLSPKRKSLLPELLNKRRPDIAISEISDGLEVFPGRLYLCPPGKEIRIHKKIFRVAAPASDHVHLPIDEFFISLAEEAGERAIGVIFSGAGTDGARGIRAIRDMGGTVFVQDPSTAEFAGMPTSAINTGQVDRVLPPEEIAREIVKLHDAGAAASAPDSTITPEEFENFYRLIHAKTGYRFNHYKKNVVGRRIRRRMYLRGASSISDYMETVTNSDAEASSLASDLMIGVTSFFRDRLAWKALRIGVIRKLAAEDSDRPARVWTPACATGEEAYSIAMMLSSEFGPAGTSREIQVFATDVNDKALEKAREGKYPGSIAADVPPDLMRKFFACSEDGISVVIDKVIRESVVFAKQDLLTDPPFSNLDLIICRNLLIYLEPDAQEKCIALFHYALKNGGYLFLGNAESVGKHKALFRSLPHKKCRIYQKIETAPAARLPLAVPFAAERTAPAFLRQTAIEHQQLLTAFIQESLLEEYAPAAVAVNQNLDVLYHNGPTNRYLHQPRGAPTQNLLELLSENLRRRVRSAVYRANQETRPVSIRAVIPLDNGPKRQITLRISKVRDNLFLIVFREKAGIPEESEAVSLNVAVDETTLRQLESELSATRAELQSHIEQLKSLNEELQASNEELQAANEELETSREELQSLNEELITVNSQLQTKIEEQEETNNDLNNFLASTNIPTVFLDTRFRLKRFTPAMSKLLKLIPSDIGRPILDMSQEGLGSDLISDARSVLDHLSPVKKEIELNGAWYIRTALPYRTTDNHIEGVVITYADITELKQVEERTRHLASFPQVNPSPVIELDSSGRITFFNPGTERILEDLGLDKGNVAVFLPEDLHDILRKWDRETEATLYREIAVADKVFGATVHLVPQFDAVRIYARDITERTRVEEKLRESEERVRLKLESILSPGGDIGDLELSDIIDVEAVQSLMNDFYKLARMPMSIIDLKGRMLVGVGWQDICMKFHRVHPETCRNCMESDLQLTAGVPSGEFKLYKCKNNMWDVSTPIMVGGKHMGNLFMGQFFFDDETLDYDFFRAQAKEYGFDEKEYIAALEAVPRMSRESLDTSMAFFLKLAEFLSRLSYGNIKLARSLADLEALMESLRQSEERLSRAQEIAHLGSWELDLINNRLTWSDEVYRIFGLEPQEFAATYEAFLERVHPDDRAAVDDAYSGSLREGRDAYEVEHRVVRRGTGEIRYVHEKCEHFRDDTGKIIRSVGMVHDITERKIADEALHKSEMRYRTLFDSIDEGFCIVEIIFDENDKPVDYRFLETNPSFEKQTGLINVQGKRMRELVPGHEEYWFETYGQIALTGNSARFENRAEHLQRWYDVYAFRFGEPENRQVAILFNDITGRKKAEDRIRRHNAVLDGINRIFHESLTCETEEELGRTCLAIAENMTQSKFGFIGEIGVDGLIHDVAISDPGWELCTMEDKTGHHRPLGNFKVHGIYGRVLLDGKSFFTNDPASHPDSIGTPEGHPPLKAFLGVPLIHSGKTIGMIGLGNREGGYRTEDLEALESLGTAIVQAFMSKRAEMDVLKLGEDMAVRNIELEAVNRELEAFIYSISHDLRAPIRSMSGFARILVEDYAGILDKQGLDYLARIHRGSEKMTHLIDDLLHLSRVSRQDMEKTEVDLSLIAASIISDMRETDPERSVEVSIEKDLTSQADRRLIELVLSNLLGNAWKFTSKTENPRIEFGAFEQEGKTVYFIRDNGAGFDPNYVDKLFRPFHRLHSEIEFEGTGIGLTIVDRIIRRHGGTVWAESDIGKGATVYFTLG
jgi:two-component system CheB/CheR fusion protein